MSQKAPKLLVETSAVRPLIDFSASVHIDYLRNALSGDPDLWTSVYVRKEFIRRWVCDGLRAAFIAAQSKDAADAGYEIEQDFSIRNIKGFLAVLLGAIRQDGAIPNDPIQFAEALASQGVRLLRLFDRKLPKKINNASKCQIGSRPLTVDWNNWLHDVHAYYEVFRGKPIEDCEVNDFLQMSNPKGRLKPLFDDPDASKEFSVQKAKKLCDNNKWITCKDCGSIGDVVIALEQPRSHTLVHTDGAFNSLCPSLGKKNLPILSVTAAIKQSRESPAPPSIENPAGPASP